MLKSGYLPKLIAAIFMVAAIVTCNQGRRADIPPTPTKPPLTDEQAIWAYYHLDDLLDQNWRGIVPGLTTRREAHHIIFSNYDATVETYDSFEKLRWKMDLVARFDSTIRLKNETVTEIDLVMPPYEITAGQVVDTFGDPLVFIRIWELHIPENHCGDGYVLHYADYDLNVHLDTTVDDTSISRDTPVWSFELYSPADFGPTAYVYHAEIWEGFDQEYCIDYDFDD